MDRLAELESKALLTDDEVIEYFMLKSDCDIATAEMMFEQYASEHDPVRLQ
jgi:hypothetical protein